MRVLRDAPAYCGQFHSTVECEKAAEPAPESVRLERAKMLVEIGKMHHVLSPKGEDMLRAALQEQIERDLAGFFGLDGYVGGPLVINWSEPDSDRSAWDEGVALLGFVPDPPAKPDLSRS